MSFTNFLDDLKKRKFFREISVYALTSWLIIQIAAVTHEYLGVPKYGVTLVIILLLLGLPFFMYYAWRHDVISELKGKDEEYIEDDNSPSGKFTRNLFYRLLAVTCIIVLICSGFIFKENFLDIHKLQLFEDDRVAISIFENNTQNEKYDHIGKIISDHLTRGIILNDFANVVSFATISRQSELMASMQLGMDLPMSSKNKAGASKIIEGGYYIEKNELVINANIINGQNGEVIYSFEPIRCDKDVPSSGITELEQIILGFWFSQKHDPQIQITPKYDAYQFYLKALEIYNKDYNQSLELLDKAIALDSQFVQPVFLKASVYYDLNNFTALKEVVDQLKQRDFRINSQEENLIKFYEALHAGKHLSALNAFITEYNFHPKELHTNTSLAVIYSDLVNQPTQVLKTLDEIGEDESTYNNCYYCQTRLNLMAKSLIATGKPEEAIKVLDKAPFENIRRKIFQTKIVAFSRMARFDLVDEILADPRIFILTENYKYLYMVAASEARLAGNEEKSNEYASMAWEAYKDNQGAFRMKSRIQYLLNNWDQSMFWIDKFLELNPGDINALSIRAANFIHINKISLAEQLMKAIETAQVERYKGERNYELGRLNALLGNNKESVNHLLRSLQNGIVYYPSFFNNDPDLAAHLSSDELSAVMNYYSDRS